MRAWSKKEPESAKTIKREKSEVWVRKEKAQIALFPPFDAQHWKPGSRAQSQPEWEKQGSWVRIMLYINTTFHPWFQSLHIHISRDRGGTKENNNTVGCPVLAVLLQLSYPSGTVLTVLCCHSCSVFSVPLPCSSCLILAFLLWLSHSGCLVQAVMFWQFCSSCPFLSSPGYLILAVLSWQPYPSSPVLAVIS